MWVVAEVDEQEAATMRPGGLAKITLSGEGHQLPARITDSLPQSRSGRRNGQAAAGRGESGIQAAAGDAGGRRIAPASSAAASPFDFLLYFVRVP
jgi:hypothetical protein